MLNKIKIPKNIELLLNNENLEIKGKLGSLKIDIPKEISFKVDGLYIYTFSENKAILGTFLSLLTRNLKGVSQGFVLKLQLAGIGYKFLDASKVLKFKVGFSHKMICKIPENLKVTIIKPHIISIFGIDFQSINHFGDLVRSVKTPEVYKGKGIKYLDEKIIIKESKKK